MAESDDLEATLIAVARRLIKNSANPVALKLQRIIIAESFRVPEVTRMYWEKRVRSNVEYVTGLLARRAKRGEIVVNEPELFLDGIRPRRDE